MNDIHQHQRYWLYLLFAISGFSGLVYESIWSHYLKLFLGHAAYAQTLVLAIFMGGMALGAWVPSRFGGNWKNLLHRYAFVEVAIGLCAVVFHSIFVNVTDFAYDSLIPSLASPWTVNFIKWFLAAVLILPQSILLGTTFPLMSASVIRRDPRHSGTSLAMLYFTNSLGAAIGVLIGGFILVELMGLPGTILTAGLINVAVGLLAWLIARSTSESLPKRARQISGHDKSPASWRLLITASFLTGTASFIYEIGWIRMLNLVLGTSTHAFELMLSAFIFGIAFGGLWIRKRIEHLERPVHFLGWIQVIMGLLALITLTAYNSSFDIMQLLMRSVTSSSGGYFLFNAGSYGIAMIIMLPVTFCAGMTLPLITHVLLRGGYGEKSIGAVYAANTAGAIAGVFFAVHIGLSMLGLKGLIVTGAAIDMGLGVVLLGIMIKGGDRRLVYGTASAVVILLAAVIGGVEFDRYKMASGVYRHGMLSTSSSTEILYHKDGKTATVDMLKGPDGGISIATNGKVDAKIMMKENAAPSSDESTMILAGGIPLLLHPAVRTAAVIGMGSGLTTHVVLTEERLERVDTIEIEPAMIEAARGFRPHVEAPFSDSRSRFHIDDAKSFFSATRNRYDIIFSEPSNPWVSGVASLFTDEFYRRARTHLNQGGLFIQWMHVYEMDFVLVASVMKAIGRNFEDYVLYAANDGDLLIVAVRNGKVPALKNDVPVQTKLTEQLRRVDIYTLDDLKLRRIGDRDLLDPLFAYTPIPVNSDFFPILDLHAVRARFMKHDVTALTQLRSESLPALELLGGEKSPVASRKLQPSNYFLHSRRAYTAEQVSAMYLFRSLPDTSSIEPNLLRHVMITQRLATDCRGKSAPDLWIDSVHEIINATAQYLSSSTMNSLWQHLRASDCYRRLHPVQKDVFALFGAVGRRDSSKMAALSEKLLQGETLPHERDGYLLAAGMLGHLTANNPEKAIDLWKTYAPRVLGSQQPSLLLRLLWSHSVNRSQNKN